METITLDKREYDRLTGNLATLEDELMNAQQQIEAPRKVVWWRRFWVIGAKAAVVALVVLSVSVFGCSSTLSDIQKSPPHIIIDSLYPAEKVAKCIVEEGTEVGLNQSILWSVGWNPLIIKKSGDDYRILVVGNQASPFAELTIKPSDTGSHIEVRVRSQ